MSNWKSTKCCGTCALWDIEAVRDSGGAVRDNRPAACKWSATTQLPESVSTLLRHHISHPSWMCRSYGTKCECYVKRGSEAHEQMAIVEQLKREVI